jgi:hypothetical protein
MCNQDSSRNRARNRQDQIRKSRDRKSRNLQCPRDELQGMGIHHRDAEDTEVGMDLSLAQVDDEHRMTSTRDARTQVNGELRTPNSELRTPEPVNGER